MEEEEEEEGAGLHILPYVSGPTPQVAQWALVCMAQQHHRRSAVVEQVRRKFKLSGVRTIAETLRRTRNDSRQGVEVNT
ncbi:hypothetical protein CRUP_027666 [Coryphaenoides rupestris]|nr:hypothetical protein CRUP_027666 [Coryphaenoides rupestris]